MIRETALLAEAAGMLQACQTTDELCEVVTRTAPSLFEGDAGAVYELTLTRSAAVAIVSWGDPPPLQHVFAPSDCWGLRRGRLHRVDPNAGEPRCRHVVEETGNGLLCVPLSAQGDTFGVLHVQVRQAVKPRRQPELLGRRQALALALGEHLSLAMANIRVRSTLQEQSSRDALTGLFNRRFMEESLDRELRRAVREGYPLGLIMADLDHLKDFNDAHGHAAGDVVLQLVGRFLQGAVRGEDVACRFGGEEFVVILPKAALEDTRRRAEAMRQGLQTQRLEPLGALLPPVTMSFGVAAFPDHGATGDVLLHAADAALYRAKATGRNRVVVAGLGDREAIDILVHDPHQERVHR
jgi:diguanylate cyclase (GGDEF)-like protein